MICTLFGSLFCGLKFTTIVTCVITLSFVISLIYSGDIKNIVFVPFVPVLVSPFIMFPNSFPKPVVQFFGQCRVIFQFSVMCDYLTCCWVYTRCAEMCNVCVIIYFLLHQFIWCPRVISSVDDFHSSKVVYRMVCNHLGLV